MTSAIPEDIRVLLEKSIDGDLDDFQVETHEGNKKGEGYLGEFFFVSLTNKQTNEVHHLAIKQTLASDSERSMKFMSKVFHNETCFYETIWPALSTFQDGFPDVEKFTKISKYYAAAKLSGGEKISLENLKYKGFLNYDKTKFFESKQLEFVLKSYGQFHAMSMAFRQLEPENFKEITESLVSVSEIFNELQFFKKAIIGCCTLTLSTLDKEKEKDIFEKFEVYAQKGTEIYDQVSVYDGEYPILLHGDCWSNNIMFKYGENNEVEDLRLIDFQLTKLGTVVYDLSYCIYASASPEALEDLDHYLSVYHQSLSESLRGYGLDSESVYPFSVLKQEWKQYSKFGLIMGILINAGKLQDPHAAKNISEIITDEENGVSSDEAGRETLSTAMNSSEKYRKTVRNLVLHAYKNNYL